MVFSHIPQRRRRNTGQINLFDCTSFQQSLPFIILRNLDKLSKLQNIPVFSIKKRDIHYQQIEKYFSDLTLYWNTLIKAVSVSHSYVVISTYGMQLIQMNYCFLSFLFTTALSGSRSFE